MEAVAAASIIAEVVEATTTGGDDAVSENLTCVRFFRE